MHDKFFHIERSIKELLASLEYCGISLREIHEVVEAGEFGIAIEDLCTQLVEHDVSLSGQQKDNIAVIARQLTVYESYWHQLVVKST